MSNHKSINTLGRLVILLFVFAAIMFALIMYGPDKTISDMYITTAMHTSDHQYLAKMLYSEDYIKKVLERNDIIQQEGISAIIRNNQPGASIELTDISCDSFNGWVLTVDDPGTLSIVPSLNGGNTSEIDDETLISEEEFGVMYVGTGELLEEIAERNSAVAAINASGYVSNVCKDVPTGIVIYDHNMIHGCKDKLHSFIALTDDNDLVFGRLSAEQILSRDFRDVIEFGPILILNGQPSAINGNGGGIAPRTAIGQTGDGKILLVVIDGMQTSSAGAYYDDVQRIMLEHGAVNAMALDGGASSSMYYNGEIVNSPNQGELGRFLPNAVIIRQKNTGEGENE